MGPGDLDAGTVEYIADERRQTSLDGNNGTP